LNVLRFGGLGASAFGYAPGLLGGVRRGLDSYVLRLGGLDASVFGNFELSALCLVGSKWPAVCRRRR
jgi:hypothetical protein